MANLVVGRGMVLVDQTALDVWLFGFHTGLARVLLLIVYSLWLANKTISLSLSPIFIACIGVVVLHLWAWVAQRCQYK